METKYKNINKYKSLNKKHKKDVYRKWLRQKYIQLKILIGLNNVTVHK